MIKRIILIAALVMFPASIVLSQDNKDTEKVDDHKSWGNSISIGIPISLYNNDTLTGIDISFPIIDRFVIRLNAHMLYDFYDEPILTWKGLRNRKDCLVVTYPSVSFIGRSRVFYNMRVYGGATIGIAYEQKNKKVFPHTEGFGGAEFYINRHTAFFAEFGGGGVFSKRHLDYGGGGFLTGGVRFYF
jgi:hypothetical protein